MTDSGHPLATAQCDERTKVQRVLPPEQEVRGSNPLGRTKSPSLSVDSFQAVSDKSVSSSKYLDGSGHQLATCEGLVCPAPLGFTYSDSAEGLRVG